MKIDEAIKTLQVMYDVSNHPMSEISTDEAEAIKIAISAMQELQQYMELEEQGRLLKLPCAVGDTVYTNLSATGWYLRKKNRPYAVKIVFIGINGANNLMNVVYENGNMTQFLFSEIGKTVFLTREAAEKALEEMKSE